jgi:hypothetical protein
MDVWVGRMKVVDEAAATQPAGRMTDLKWSWSEGSGSVRFDHFEVSPLEAALATTGTSPQVSPSAPEGGSLAQADETLPLERPTPNPFIQTTRFRFCGLTARHAGGHRRIRPVRTPGTQFGARNSGGWPI